MLNALQIFLKNQTEKPWFLPTIIVLFIQSPQVAAAWITVFQTMTPPASTTTVQWDSNMAPSLVLEDRKRRQAEADGGSDR